MTVCVSIDSKELANWKNHLLRPLLLEWISSEYDYPHNERSKIAFHYRNLLEFLESIESKMN